MFVLSESTAGKLRDLIGDKGNSAGVPSAGSSVQQICHVVCDSWNSTTNQGTGRVVKRDGSGWTAFGTAADMLLFSANDEDLTVSTRYIAIRYGAVSTTDIFVAAALAEPLDLELGCGLEFDEDDKLTLKMDDIVGVGLENGSGCRITVKPGCGISLGASDAVNVDGSALAGCGLKVHSGELCELEVDAEYLAGAGLEADAGGDCRLDAKIGCGLKFGSSSEITVDTDDLIGLGLESEGTCGLSVKAGCGIAVNSGGVNFNASAVAGNGLETVSLCGLQVEAGCGINVDSGGVSVDLAEIRGQGLSVLGTEGCLRLGIVPGCHISLNGGGDGDEVSVDVSGMAGCGLAVVAETAEDCAQLKIDTVPDGEYSFSAVTAVDISIVGCQIKVTSTVTPFELVKNECGVVIGFEAGEPDDVEDTIDLPVTEVEIPTGWTATCHENGTFTITPLATSTYWIVTCPEPEEE